MQLNQVLVKNRQQAQQYSERMRDEWWKHYGQIRTITPSRRVRVRTTPSPERSPPQKHKLFKIPQAINYTTSTKATVILPLQNEHEYTMPETRQGCRCVELSPQLGIVLGGFSHRESTEINFMDLQSGQWLKRQKVSEFDRLRQILKENENVRFGSHFSINVDEQSIYLFGGERVQGVRRSSNTLTKIHEGIVEQWVMNSIPPRRNHTGTLLDQQLIIIGGFEDINTRPTFYGDIHYINITTMRTQTTKQLFKSGIAYHSAVKDQENIYIFGGKDEDDVYYKDLYAVDSQFNLSQMDTKGMPPKARRSFTMNYDPNSQTIVLFGGTNDIEFFDDLHTFNVQSRTWCKVSLSGYLHYSPRYDHCSFFSNEKLIIFGGLNEYGFMLFNPILITLRLKRQKISS